MARVDNSGMYIQGLEEAERKDRLVDDGLRTNNAHKVAQLIKTNSLPELKRAVSRGPSGQCSILAEQERMRILGNLDEMRAKKAHAMTVATMIKSASASSLCSQGIKGYTNKLEARERQRRLDNREECVARKVNAYKASEAIRTGSLIARARFVKSTPNITSRWFSQVTALVQRLPSASTIAHTATVLGENLVHSIQTTMYGSVDLVSVRASEEKERARRIAEDPSGYARSNACRVSGLIKLGGWHLSSCGGFHKFTRSVEEYERTRRLQNKNESELHRALARELSQLISQLGWPLLQSRKGWASTAFASAFEDERERRLADTKGMFTARHNATKVAGMVIDAFQFQNKDFLLQCTRELEEQERKFRIANGGKYSVHNAHRHAQMIRDIGGEFYHPCSPIAKRNAYLNESKHNLKKSQTLNAEKEAKIDLKALKSQDFGYDTKQMLSYNTSFLEKEEKKRRISDKSMQQVAISNAAQVSRMIKQRSPYRKATRFSPLLCSEMVPSTISPTSLPVSLHYPTNSGYASPAVKASIPLKKLPSRPDQKKRVESVDQKLIDQVTKLYQRELQLAEKERAKLVNISRKRGLFADFRLHNHTEAAAKHTASANRHAQWLSAVNALPASSTSSQVPKM